MILQARSFGDVPFEKWMGKVPTWECLHVHRKRGFFSSVYVDDSGCGDLGTPEDRNQELYEANPLTDQIRKEKSWLCDELEMRNRAFQEDRARNCPEI